MIGHRVAFAHMTPGENEKSHVVQVVYPGALAERSTLPVGTVREKNPVAFETADGRIVPSTCAMTVAPAIGAPVFASDTVPLIHASIGFEVSEMLYQRICPEPTYTV